jgi:para-nitrobenzyl esterase
MEICFMQATSSIRCVFAAMILSQWISPVFSATPAPDPARVRIESGVIKGALNADIVAFKGIPYAAPPVGDLRWRAPRTAHEWQGELKADHYGPLCMQTINPRDNGTGSPPASENCLTLNVWKPIKAAKLPVAKLPVMVWIHGGGFVNGSGTAALYDGSQLARLGVVVVTINYRLGRLGFFAHPALTKESPKSLLANYGLMDQLAALQWVQRNIPAFGGDPKNVTLFGESAGGMSVQRLMIATQARGLFQKAIVQSGAGTEHMAKLFAINRDGLASAEDLGKKFAESLGVTTNDVRALRALPATKIIAAGDPSPAGDGGPIIDGKMLTEDVEDAFIGGHEAKIPYLVGANSLEFPIPAGGFAGAAKKFTHIPPDELQQFAVNYADQQDYEAQFISDVVFVEPARHLAALHARSVAHTFLYRFAFISAAVRPVLKGAPHASERQYVFDTLSASPWKTDDSDQAVARNMSAYWVAFAKTGDPNGSDRPTWPAYSAAGDELLEFANDATAARKAPFTERLNAITQYGAKH